jgi:large subunit ribosomal protein L3
MLELVGKKIGMSHSFNEVGVMTPLTFIEIYSNQVIELNNDNENYNRLVIGFNKITNNKKISKSLAGVFNKKSIPLHKFIKGCKVSRKSEIKAGDILEISKFINLGDKISISGISTGKGFAGVMKRWNFRGLEASHGVSISHRSHGSTGQRQDPGKTFQGKKMAGHMGVDKVTVRNLKVEVIDQEKSVIAVKGAIPGKTGTNVVIKIKN